MCFVHFSTGACDYRRIILSTNNKQHRTKQHQIVIDFYHTENTKCTVYWAT